MGGAQGSEGPECRRPDLFGRTGEQPTQGAFFQEGHHSGITDLPQGLQTLGLHLFVLVFSRERVDFDLVALAAFLRVALPALTRRLPMEQNVAARHWVQKYDFTPQTSEPCRVRR